MVSLWDDWPHIGCGFPIIKSHLPPRPLNPVRFPSILQQSGCIIYPELLFRKPHLSYSMLLRKGWPCCLALWPGLANQSAAVSFCPSWFVQPWLSQVRPIRGFPWRESQSYYGKLIEPELLWKTTLQGLWAICMTWSIAACDLICLNILGCLLTQVTKHLPYFWLMFEFGLISILYN